MKAGTLVGIVGISTDITDRKQTEELIRRSERAQRQLAEQLAAERARLLEAQAVAHLGSWETDIATLEVDVVAGDVSHLREESGELSAGLREHSEHRASGRSRADRRCLSQGAGDSGRISPSSIGCFFPMAA